MSIDDSKLIIFVLILVMLVLWLRAVKKLSIAYKERTEELEAAQATSA